MRTKLYNLIDRSSFVGRFHSDCFEKILKVFLLKSDKDQMLSIDTIEENNVPAQALPAVEILRSVVPRCPLCKRTKSEELSTSKFPPLRIKLTGFEQTYFLDFFKQQLVVVMVVGVVKYTYHSPPFIIWQCMYGRSIANFPPGTFHFMAAMAAQSQTLSEPMSKYSR
jgi:hypothetical protein